MPARPELGHTNASARARGNQEPPLPGGSILVPPSPDTYVFRFPAAPSPELLSTLEAVYGLTLVEQEPASDETMGLFHGPAGLDLHEILEDLGDEVTDASPNLPVNLVEDASLTGGFVVGEWAPDSVSTAAGLELLGLSVAHTVGRGAGSRIAIVDTGADVAHPFFEGHLHLLPPGATLISKELLDGIDDDHDGEIDEAYGHGTHVAGIILQVAPEATLVPIRALNADGVGSLWDLISGIGLAVAQDVGVINLSIAMAQPNEMMESLLGKYQNEGIVTVAAAGNAGLANPTYPGTSVRTVGVAAVDGDGVLTAFSGGGLTIDLAAPGWAVRSTFPDLRTARASGTSMATAAVSGTIALLRDGAGLGAVAAAQRIRDTAEPIQPPGTVLAGLENPIAALGISRD